MIHLLQKLFLYSKETMSLEKFQKIAKRLIETFIYRLNNFSKTNILVQNNNKIENQILLELKNFLIKNKNLSDNEIFSAIDKDCDGIINILFLNKFYILLITKFNKARIKKEIINLLV